MYAFHFCIVKLGLPFVQELIGNLWWLRVWQEYLWCCFQAVGNLKIIKSLLLSSDLLKPPPQTNKQTNKRTTTKSQPPPKKNHEYMNKWVWSNQSFGFMIDLQFQMTLYVNMRQLAFTWERTKPLCAFSIHTAGQENVHVNTAV